MIWCGWTIHHFFRKEWICKYLSNTFFLWFHHLPNILLLFLAQQSPRRLSAVIYVVFTFLQQLDSRYSDKMTLTVAQREHVKSEKCSTLPRSGWFAGDGRIESEFNTCPKTGQREDNGQTSTCLRFGVRFYSFQCGRPIQSNVCRLNFEWIGVKTDWRNQRKPAVILWSIFENSVHTRGRKIDLFAKWIDVSHFLFHRIDGELLQQCWIYINMIRQLKINFCLEMKECNISSSPCTISYKIVRTIRNWYLFHFE